MLMITILILNLKFIHKDDYGLLIEHFITYINWIDEHKRENRRKILHKHFKKIFFFKQFCRYTFSQYMANECFNFNSMQLTDVYQR